MEVPNITPLESTTLLLQTLSLIRTQLKQVSPSCTMVQVVEYAVAELIQPEELQSNLVTPILGENTAEVFKPVEAQKFARLCSVVVVDVTEIISSLPVVAAGSEEEEEDAEDEDEGKPKIDWPRLKLYGCPHWCYHIFIFKANGSSGEYEPQLAVFAQKTRRAQEVFFLVESGDVVTLYSRSNTGEELKLLQTFGGSESNLQLERQRPNYYGAPLITNVCAKCGDGLEIFRRTGIWYFFFEAAMYEVTLAVNGSLEFEKIAAPQAEGPDEEGDWDQWKGPLMDGSAAVSAFTHYTIPALKALHYIRPVTSGYAQFITARPKRFYGGEKLSSFLKPLSLKVWIGSCVSVVALFFALELTLHAHRSFNLQRLSHQFSFSRRLSAFDVSMVTRLIPRHEHVLSFTELVKPWIVQGGAAITFEKNIENDSLAKLLFGIWLLVLNVLASTYQSEMTSAIVSPEYIRPPQTFRELAESNFKTFAVVWQDNLDKDFASLNNSFSRKLLETTQEFNSFEPDCYVAVLQGDNACIGLYGPMSNIGYVFLYDVAGKRLFVESRETLFTEPVTFVVSPYYVPIVEPFNFIVRTLESGGILRHWDQNGKEFVKKRGKAFAKQRMKTMKIYAGQGSETPETIIPILRRIVTMGLGSASAMFVLELIGDIIRDIACAIQSLLSDSLGTQVQPYMQ